MSSAQQLLLTALRCDIDNLNHLATTADIVSDVSQFIHVLQRERGASTIYLASKGKRFMCRTRLKSFVNLTPKHDLFFTIRDHSSITHIMFYKECS